MIMLSRCQLKQGVRAFVGRQGSNCSIQLHRDVTVKSAGALALPNVEDLAKLAHLEVTDQEVKDWKPKIGSIVAWMGQLQQVNVESVKPAIHAIIQQTSLRPDVAVAYNARPQLLDNVPDTQDSYIKVPKIATAADASSPAATAVAAEAVADPAAEAEPSVNSEAGPTPEELAALHALDIRVGMITSCELHPDADALYVESIDTGDAEPRTIVSGLRKYVPLEQMQNRRVVVLCNLKPRNMRGIKSFGMLLAASDDAHENVDPIAPPEGAAVGERVWFGDLKEQPKAAEPNQVQKKKYWESAGPGLKTDANKVANWRGLAMNTSAGPVTSATLPNARIA